MRNRRKTGQCFAIFSALVLMPELALSVDVWNGLGPNNDLNNAGNWTSLTVPTSGVPVAFDSSVPNINFTPVSLAAFSVNSMTFPASANAFSFLFNNCTLQLAGPGIISQNGSPTNTQITVNNVNNSSSMVNQINFSDVSGSTSGSATLFVNNNGTRTVDNGGTINNITTQFLGVESLSIGRGGQLNVTNTGQDSSLSLGVGSNTTGLVDNYQLRLGATLVASDSSSVSVFNSGSITGTTGGSNVVGEVGISQFSSDLLAGNSFTLTATNLGNDSNTSSGSNLVGFVDQQQIEFNTVNAGNGLNIDIVNMGLNQGHGIGDRTGAIGARQLYCGLDFVSGDSLKITTRNTGMSSNTNLLANYSVGTVGIRQNEFFSSFTTGNNSSIHVINEGFDNSVGGVTSTIAYVGDQQILFNGPLVAGNNFNVTTQNSAIASGGAGNKRTGLLSSIQTHIFDTFTVGSNCSLTTTNTGNFSGNYTSAGNITASVQLTQIDIRGVVQTGDDFIVIASNNGTDTSSGPGGNSTGTILGSEQLFVESTVTLGNNAKFLISNSGVDQGFNSSTQNSIGFINGNQSTFGDAFSANDGFSLIVTNQGTSSNTTTLNNLVGFVGGNQTEFQGAVSVGNNAAFQASNSGSYNSSSSAVGVVSGGQLVFDQTFNAGLNLTMTASNVGINDAGVIQNPQIAFSGECTFGDGSIISASNSGTLTSGQIVFSQGFTAIGSSKIEAINTGILSGYGLVFGGGSEGAGGDVGIFLTNSSLIVSNSNPTFTIGSLNGNSNSTVQSFPQLVIALDAGVNANFAGSILDVMGPSAPTSLYIQGLGSQTLSGINTFTGLTTVDGPATLVLNTSLEGDLLINGGTLKGNGSAFDVTFNGGIIAPGQSIGTLSFNSLTANGLTYDVEVSSIANDLVNVATTAMINGGKVIVSSVDGTYKFGSPYTILQAVAVDGQFASIRAVAPFIKPTLGEDGQHIYLTLFPQFSNIARTHNQRAVAAQLDTILDPSALESTLLNELSVLAVPDILRALSSLSGWQYTNDLWLVENANDEFFKRLYNSQRAIVTSDPRDCCNTCEDWSVWLEAGAIFSNLRGNENAFGFSTSGAEATVGIQKTFSFDLTVGFAGSYEYKHIDYKNYGGTSNYNTFLAGLYGLYRPSYFYALADLSYGYTTNILFREMSVGTINVNAKSHPQIQSLSSYGEIGVDWSTRFVLVQPFAGISAGGIWSEEVRESSDSGWELAIRSKDHHFVRSRLGLHLTTTDICFANISFDIAWARRITDSNVDREAQFIQFGNQFVIEGVHVNNNSIDYALTLSKTINNYGCYAQCSGQTWDHANIVNFIGGVQYSW